MVGAVLVREKEFAVFAQHLIFRKHLLPHLHGGVEFRFRHLQLLVHEQMRLVIHQVVKFLGEHDVHQLVELGVGKAFQQRR